MNIGDVVSISLAVEVEGMERDIISKQIYVTGRVKDENNNYLFVKVPALACEVTQSKLVDALKDAYLNVK